MTQNLEACRDPVLLGRLYAEHLRRIEEIPSDNDLLVVRWRTDLGEDWWPAKVIKTVEDNVEVVYTGYEGDDGSETIELGGDLWTADVRCLGDDREPVFDSRDAALLDGGDFGDMAVEAEDDDEEYKRYKTDSEEDLYDDNGIQIARKKRKKTDGDKGEKKAKKAPRKKREARMRPKKVHLASEIAIRRAQWSVGARAPTVVTKPPPQQAEPVEDDSIPRWKRALLAAAPPPAPARRPASTRATEDDDSGKQKRSTLANKRAKAPRPSALELLGAIRAPTESLGNAPKAAVATQNDSRNAATEAARDRAREVEAAMLRAGRGVAPPPAPPPAPAPARKGAEIDDFHVDEFEAGRRRAPSSKSDLPTYQRPNASKPLPPGWTAKWSARKQMYYYTHKAKGLTRWTPPREEKSPRAKKPAPAPPSNDDALKRARATLAALEGSLPDSAPPVPADALAAAAAASRWDAPPPDAQGAAAQRYVEQQRRYDAPAGGFAPQPPPPSGFAPAPPFGGYAPAPPNPRGGERRPPGHSGPYRRN